jgi:hypothetical protein
MAGLGRSIPAGTAATLKNSRRATLQADSVRTSLGAYFVLLQKNCNESH